MCIMCKKPCLLKYLSKVIEIYKQNQSGEPQENFKVSKKCLKTSQTLTASSKTISFMKKIITEQ